MTYRSLLVLLDQDPLCAARSQVAIRLAKALDCHLVGLAPTGLIDMPAFAVPAISLSEFAERAWDTLRDQANLAAHGFRIECSAAGLKSFEAVIDPSEQALSLDLIVMGAYGHARWTERVLGGATRGLLASMTVPVLMSH